ncbi:hypothetical protein Q8F57_043475 [Paraburkholderia terrae]|uniref:hypothetical protein n=1 Tax=Paraburkholderia terrae TaxID=311230 RepID=UPI00296A9EF2|nr:hypothetical protein [Paraburkholderia terrae]MDW3656535.1 hypothetical protein [Paraburkholderia terrae]
MENFTRLGLFCRLFLGLFVGFFCVTAALFVRYMSAEQLPQVTVLQSKNASQALSGSAPAVPFTSAFPLQSTTPSLHTEEKTLIASSASTFVAFIAAAVTNFLSWRKGGLNKVRSYPLQSIRPDLVEPPRSLSCPLFEHIRGDLANLPGKQIERPIVFEQDGTPGYVGSAPTFFNSQLAFLARATPWHNAGICDQRRTSSSRPHFSRNRRGEVTHSVFRRSAVKSQLAR